MRLARSFGALLAVAVAGCVCAGALAQDASLELAVKANYLYKLTPFVDWPNAAFSGPAAPLRICVAGRDPFGALLEQAVAGQGAGERPVEIRRLPRVERSDGCHVLYAGGAPSQPVDAMLRTVRGLAVLTVTDGDLPPAARGIVHFVVQGGRVRFELDDQAAAANSLAISAKLLSLAVSVRPRG